VYIEKEDGRQRPLGVAALEDKIVQQAVATILNQIYEEDFLGFSYGFRPGRSQHDALDALSYALLKKKVNYILDADIRSFFDNLDKSLLVKFMEHRVADPRILRLIQKWLKAGVMEDGKWSETQTGTPQGSVITPRTQKITSNLTARSSWSVGHGTANDTSSNLDICRIWLYLYVICLAPVPLRGHNASIAHAPCCSVAVHSPQLFSSLPKCAPFPLARPIAISGRPSA
jgi:hypothetical protein